MIKCKNCGRELDESNFKLTRWGEYSTVCKECVTKKMRETKTRMENEKREAYIRANNEKRTLRLADFSPRELMEELARRGYTGKLTVTEVHEIDITNF